MISRSRTAICSVLAAVAVSLPCFAFAQTASRMASQATSVADEDSQQIMREMVAIATQPLRQRELELTQDQIVELRALSGDYSKEMLSLRAKFQEDIAAAQKMFEAGQQSEAQKLLFGAKEPANEVAKQYVAKFEKILLPHQSKRARQISMQESFRRMNRGSNEFGIFLLAAYKLSLSEDEKAAIRDAVVEENKEFYRQVELLREKSREKIAKAIPEAKKQEFKDLLGDFYDSSESRRDSLRFQRDQKAQQDAARSDR